MMQRGQTDELWDSFLAVKVTNAGLLDNTFGVTGVTGVTETRFVSQARPHVISGDGRTRVMLIGQAGTGMMLTRYLLNGVLDSSFGIAGRVDIGVPGEILIFVTITALKRSRSLKSKELWLRLSFSGTHKDTDQTFANHYEEETCSLK